MSLQSTAGLVFGPGRETPWASRAAALCSAGQRFLPVPWRVPFCSGGVFGDGFLRLRSDGSRRAFENLLFVLLLLPRIGSSICPLKANTHFWASFLEILVKWGEDARLRVGRTVLENQERMLMELGRFPRWHRGPLLFRIRVLSRRELSERSNDRLSASPQTWK